MLYMIWKEKDHIDFRFDWISMKVLMPEFKESPLPVLQDIAKEYGDARDRDRESGLPYMKHDYGFGVGIELSFEILDYFRSLPDGFVVREFIPDLEEALAS